MVPRAGHRQVPGEAGPSLAARCAYLQLLNPESLLLGLQEHPGLQVGGGQGL